MNFLVGRGIPLFKRKLTPLILGLAIILLSLFLSGCSEKPFLTQDGSYVILSISPSGMTQSELIDLPWNTNKAIMQNLLVECSFVLSDLRTTGVKNPSITTPTNTTLLQTNFSQPKRMSFLVDKKVLTLDVQSLQIEVEGANIGQVTLNQIIILQGIKNPNLRSAFKAVREMLHGNN